MIRLFIVLKLVSFAEPEMLWLIVVGGLSVEDAWPIEELETYYREVLKVPF